MRPGGWLTVAGSPRSATTLPLPVPVATLLLVTLLLVTLLLVTLLLVTLLLVTLPVATRALAVVMSPTRGPRRPLTHPTARSSRWSPRNRGRPARSLCSREAGPHSLVTRR
jgi:hypothetical protein